MHLFGSTHNAANCNFQGHNLGFIIVRFFKFIYHKNFSKTSPSRWGGANLSGEREIESLKFPQNEFIADNSGCGN